MDWGLTIHKAQCMTLQKETIDIGKIDHQGLTFTDVSRVRNLSGLHINPTFSFSRYAHMQDSTCVQHIKQEQSLIASKSIIMQIH